MKVSKYNVTVPIEDDKYLIYNTLRRKYLMCDNSQRNTLNNLLNNINKGQYTLQEIEYMKKFIQKGIVIKNDVDELEIIEFLQNKRKFENKTLIIVVQPTLDCNFRCTYCYEEHKKVKMDNKTAANVLKYIKKNTKNYKKLLLAWFGGEPLLEIKRIFQLTSEIKNICNLNNVCFYSSMTTNGYLFTDDIINKIEDLSIKKIQITIDGSEKYHNAKRPLANGKGTYKRILNNIIKLAKKNITINLRINIDKDNYEYIDDLFNDIPVESRNKIVVYISNLFQAKNKFKTYEIYKSAIEKGFKYNNTSNSFNHCEVCRSNSITIEPNGRVVPCSVAGENGYYYGNINEQGNLIFKNESLFYKIKNVSALNNDNCKKCKQLPICLGGCSLARYKDNNYCTKNENDCLNLNEIVKLHYYHDIKHGLLKGDTVYEK